MDESAQSYVSQSNGNIEDESMLNNNLDFSSIEMSTISIGNGSSNSSNIQQTNGELGITLSEKERQLLQKYQTEGVTGNRTILKSISMLTSSMLQDSIAEKNTTKDNTISYGTEQTINVEESIVEEIFDDDESYKEEARRVQPEILLNVTQEEGDTLLCNQLQDVTMEEVEKNDYYECKYFQSNLIELGRRCWTSSAEKQHYTKGCLWSPDGTCLLVPVHLDGMHVLELPIDLYETPAIDGTRALSPLKSAVHIPEGGTVYDCAWYPLMNSGQPDLCFWIASRQHEPIHMWDAFNGTLRCTYIGYDAVDEVESAISLKFSAGGEKIYAGYKKNIKIFDTSRPGRIYDTFPVKRAISCIAQTGHNEQTLTCGNWHGYIQHYDLRSPKLGALITLRGHSGGITYLQYAGSDGQYLLSGARKDDKVLHWDMRNYQKPVASYKRTVATNQRIYFDLSPQQEWLASGDTTGLLHLWQWGAGTFAVEDVKELKLPLHNDCLNGVNFHPMRPIMATSSGQYHFFNDKTEETQTNSHIANEQQQQEKELIIDYENALLLLWFGSGT